MAQARRRVSELDAFDMMADVVIGDGDLRYTCFFLISHAHHIKKVLEERRVAPRKDLPLRHVAAHGSCIDPSVVPRGQCDMK